MDLNKDELWQALTLPIEQDCDNCTRYSHTIYDEICSECQHDFFNRPRADRHSTPPINWKYNE